MKKSHILLAAALSSCFVAPRVLAQTPTAQTSKIAALIYTKPLGIALEEWKYPFPVRFFSVTENGQNLRLAYMDVAPVGKANGRSVVLLHGKNFGGEYFEDTMRVLARAGFRVIVPDQIGFGKSSKPDVNYAYSFDLMAAQTAALLTHLKVPRAAILGHSMGGMLAVRFARNFPNRTSHLILENPLGLEDYRFKVPPRSTQSSYLDEMKNTDSTKIRAFLRRYFVTWQPRYERFVEIRSRIALSGEYSRWAQSAALTYQMIYQQPVRHEFALIQPKTLLVIGQEDRTTIGRGFTPEAILKTLGQYPQLGRAAARDIPLSTLLELPKVGHIPHLEAPQRFHAALLQFLRS